MCAAVSGKLLHHDVALHMTAPFVRVVDVLFLATMTAACVKWTGAAATVECRRREPDRAISLSKAVISRLRSLMRASFVAQNAFELSTEMKEGVRELKLSARSGSVRIGMWANINAKGGRMRNVPYPDLDMSVEIPKPIAAQLIAVRVMHLVRGCACMCACVCVCLCVWRARARKRLVLLS